MKLIAILMLAVFVPAAAAEETGSNGDEETQAGDGTDRGGSEPETSGEAAGEPNGDGQPNDNAAQEESGESAGDEQPAAEKESCEADDRCLMMCFAVAEDTGMGPGPYFDPDGGDMGVAVPSKFLFGFDAYTGFYGCWPLPEGA